MEIVKQIIRKLGVRKVIVSFVVPVMFFFSFQKEEGILFAGQLVLAIMSIFLLLLLSFLPVFRNGKKEAIWFWLWTAYMLIPPAVVACSGILLWFGYGFEAQSIRDLFITWYIPILKSAVGILALLFIFIELFPGKRNGTSGNSSGGSIEITV